MSALMLTQNLSEVEAMILAEAAGEQTAFKMQPSQIKFPSGGAGIWQMGDDAAKSFVATVALSQIVRGYWPGTGTKSRPICSSPDGIRGYFADNPQQSQIEDGMRAAKPHPGVALMIHQDAVFPESFACAGCPMDAFGSGKGGRGKGCKEMRRLLLFIDGWALPAILSLPVMSVKVWDSYCYALASRKSSYFAVRTKFELDGATSGGGDSYNVVRVTAVDAVPVALLPEVISLRKQYRELVSRLPVEDEYSVEESEVPSSVDKLDEVPF